jgi:hypothetical protein
VPDLPDLTDKFEELPKEITELIGAVAKLPDESRSEIGPILDRVIQISKRRRSILLAVQDSLSQLRVDMKYLMFDLEATRRERDEYRRHLD